MTPTELNWNEKLWNQSKRRLKSAEQVGTDAVLRCCVELVSDLCCDREQITEMLTWATEQNLIDGSIPSLWQRELELGSRSPPPAPALHSRRPRVPSLRPDDSQGERLPLPQYMAIDTCDASPIVCDGSLPQQLHPYVEAIARFGRKQGWAAAELGAQLCEAQRVCLEAKYRFADFLLYIKREYGLSRGSCYLYMKYHEWGLPKELGSAVMKWIVQGFRKGSPEAQMVIEAAVGEGLTLAVLSQRFGVLRDRVVVDSSGGNAERNARIIARLTQEEQRLRTRQKVIEQRLSEVDRRIRQLRTEFTQRPPEESDFPRENMN